MNFAYTRSGLAVLFEIYRTILTVLDHCQNRLINFTGLNNNNNCTRRGTLCRSIWMDDRFNYYNTVPGRIKRILSNLVERLRYSITRFLYYICPTALINSIDVYTVRLKYILFIGQIK